MRFERSIDIDAPQQRVWEVLTDIEAWPKRIATVETVELLTQAPLTKGSRVRLKQPRLPEGVWEITAWEAPTYFEWIQKGGGMTTVAGHRVEALGDAGARLTLTLDMRGVLIPVVALFFKGLTNDYISREAEGMKRVAESGEESWGRARAIYPLPGAGGRAMMRPWPSSMTLPRCRSSRRSTEGSSRPSRSMPRSSTCRPGSS